MNILNLVLSSIGTIATQVVGIVGGVFSGVSSIWITQTNDTYELTLVGAFSLLAFVFGLVYFGISFVGSLVRLRTVN